MEEKILSQIKQLQEAIKKRYPNDGLNLTVKILAAQPYKLECTLDSQIGLLITNEDWLKILNLIIEFLYKPVTEN